MPRRSTCSLAKSPTSVDRCCNAQNCPQFINKFSAFMSAFLTTLNQQIFNETALELLSES